MLKNNGNKCQAGLENLVETETLQPFLPFARLGRTQILLLCPRLVQDSELCWDFYLSKGRARIRCAGDWLRDEHVTSLLANESGGI